MSKFPKWMSVILSVVLTASLVSIPVFAETPAETTTWSLSDTLATMTEGEKLAARTRDTAKPGEFTVIGSDANWHFGTKEGSVLRLNQGWTSGSAELIFDLPEAVTSGKIVATFGLQIEAYDGETPYGWGEDTAQIAWVDAGFANGEAAYNADSDYVTRVLAGASGIHKLDWDGDLNGTSQTFTRGQWYYYELTADLDNGTRDLIVYNADGEETNRVAYAQTLAAGATIDRFRVRPVFEGNFVTTDVLIRDLTISTSGETGDFGGNSSSTPSTSAPTTSAPTTSTPSTSTPTSPDAPTYIDASQLVAGNWWNQGGSVTLEQARSNAAVIQSVLDTVGKAGGGTVVLPEGTYCLAGDYKAYGSYCLYIRYDNLTLRGAGKNGSKHKTVLKANSYWNAASSVAEADRVYRNSGIKIEGLDFNAAGNARKNIHFECFEIDGGRGYTGASDWGYEPNVNYGWDVNHKGITVSHDKMVHNVYLNDINIHSFSGETLYVGGQLVGYLEVTNCTISDTNASCFNLYATWLNVQNNQFGAPNKNCRFWIEYAPRPAYATFDASLVPSYFKYDKNTAYFAGNSFYNSAKANGIAITQGDCKPYTVIFENNSFDNKNGQKNSAIFQMAGAIYGPTYIRNNTFTNTRGPVLNFAFGGTGTLDENGVYGNWSKNKNIYLENNVGTNLGGDYIVDMVYNFNNPGSQPIENLVISGNNFSAASRSFTAVGVGGTSNLNGVKIFNNTFSNCVEPKEASEFSGDVPLFYNNTYNNTVKVTQYVGASNTMLKPFYEKLTVSASSAITATMRTGRYANGQRVVIRNDGTSAITLAANSPSKGYNLPQTKVLRSGDELELQYNKADGVWKLAENITYGDATGDGVINMLDVARLQRYLAYYNFDLGSSSVAISAGADATGDGVINMLDVARLQRYLAYYNFDLGSSSVILGPAG